MAQVKPIPDGYHTITPSITVDGAEELIAFLQKVFDAKVESSLKRPDGKVMHAEVKIGNSKVMLGDTCQSMMNPMPSNLYVYVQDVDATYRKALDAGATSMMEPTDMFWGDRMCSVTDRFGNHWSIATHVEDVPLNEIERRAQEFARQFSNG